MITKEDLQNNLSKLLGATNPSDSQEIIQKIIEHLKFITENYNDLDSDAKSLSDNLFTKIQSSGEEVLKKIPDSKEKRKLRRLYASSRGEHYQPQQFIEILESPPKLKEDNSIKIREIFLKRLQNIMDFLFDISQNTLSGASNFCQVSLFYMCVNEFLVAYHLAQHYYINQAYSHVRTVFEHLDKVELFRRKPEWAEVWLGDDNKKIRKELSPSEVRKKLGKPKYDPIYSFFSEMGPHSTYRAAKANIAKNVGPSQESNPQITMFIGGSPFVHNIIGLNTFALFAVYRVILQIVKSFGKFIDEEEGMGILKEVTEESIKYTKDYFLAWAKENKLDVEKMEDFLNTTSWENLIKMV